MNVLQKGVLLFLLIVGTAQAAEDRTLCVFDPLGAYGDY